MILDILLTYDVDYHQKEDKILVELYIAAKNGKFDLGCIKLEFDPYGHHSYSN